MSKIKKIVYIHYQPLTKKISEDFYFDDLQTNGFDVEYLNTTPLFFTNKNVETYDKFTHVSTIKSYKELESYLKKQNKKETLFISLITFEGRVFRLHRILTKQKCVLGRFARGVLPAPNIEQINTLKERLKRFQCKNLGKIVENRLTVFAKRIGIIKPFDYIFTAGKFGFLTIGLGASIDVKKGNSIQVNAIDYDLYLTKKNAPSLIDYEYILFLDEYAPYHPDFELYGIKTINAQSYYNDLNRFFSTIEQQFNKKVVVAAHPKALGYKERNLFEGRDVIFNKTCELCTHTSLILAHSSTSAFYAAMFKKKTIFLMSKEYQKCHPNLYQIATEYAKQLGAPFIYFDKEVDKIPDFEIDMRNRETLLYNYMTSQESENTKTVDIFINFLNNSVV